MEQAEQLWQSRQKAVASKNGVKDSGVARLNEGLKHLSQGGLNKQDFARLGAIESSGKAMRA